MAHVFLKTFLAVFSLCVLMPSFAHAQNGGLDPQQILDQIQASINPSMDLQTRLQLNLELARYFEKLKQTDKANAIYRNLEFDATTATVEQLGNQSEYIGTVIRQLEKSGRSSEAATFRMDLIQKALNDPGQSNTSSPFIGTPAVQIIDSLRIGKDPQAISLLETTVKSFRGDRGELQTLSRADTLMDLISASRSSYSFGFDGPIGSLSNIDAKEEELAELKDQVFKNKAIDDQIKKLTQQISVLKEKVEIYQRAHPCWKDPRVQWDDRVIDGFVCAAAKIVAGENEDSQEAWALGSTLMGKEYIKSFNACGIDMRMSARQIIMQDAWAKLALGPPPEKCEIPEDLKGAYPSGNPMAGGVGGGKGAVSIGGAGLGAYNPSFSYDSFDAPKKNKIVRFFAKIVNLFRRKKPTQNFPSGGSGLMAGGIVGGGRGKIDMKSVSIGGSGGGLGFPGMGVGGYGMPVQSCSDYIQSLRDTLSATKVTADLTKCQSEEGDDPNEKISDCLSRAEGEVNSLPDELAIPILLEASELKTENSDPKGAGASLEKSLLLLDRLMQQNSATAATNPNFPFDPNTFLISQIDQGVRNYMTSAGGKKLSVQLLDNYNQAVKMVSALRDTGTRDLLLLHVLEGLTEAAKPGFTFGATSTSP